MGCVNCLEWNRKGTLLASGSDDRTIIIWDPFKRTRENVVTTGHGGNIFSVKFMPDFCDTLVASCASNSSVKLTDTLTSRNLLDCQGCHSDRVKRLAVHQNEPHLIWSSGEDGLILQYDIRESHVCRESKSRNILIDLKSIFPSLKAKCLAVNPVRSEMLAVGATDIFNRLFDRRYLRATNNKHSCITYFAPGHLLKSNNRSNHLQSYGTTYLSFSPDGSELLASVHAEQVYLFDLLEPWERYKTFECSLSPLLLDKPMINKSTQHDLTRYNYKRASRTSWKPIHWSNLRRCYGTSQIPEEAHIILGSILSDKLRHINWKHLKVLLEHINNLLVTTKNCPDLYLARARVLLARGWRGDYYQAMRDGCCALSLNPLDQATIKCLAETSTKLGHAYSVDGLVNFIETMTKYDSPNDHELTNALELLRNFKNNSPQEMMICDNNNECDIIPDNDLEQVGLMRSFLFNDSCTDIQELLCTRYHKRDELQRSHKAYDYTQRFCGHCNMNTDIKEASFFGDNGDYIVGGSDDGAFYIWDKKTSNIVKAVDADYQILNCVQPHPNICMLATSGIESTVKLWSSNGHISHDVGELETRCMQNQKYISSDPLEAMISMLYPDLR